MYTYISFNAFKECYNQNCSIRTLAPDRSEIKIKWFFFQIVTVD